MLVPELVRKIIGYLPRTTYNQVYGKPTIYDVQEEIPKVIVLDNSIDKWCRMPPMDGKVFAQDIIELVDIHRCLPLFTVYLITLLIDSWEIFYELHQKIPDILKLYKIRINYPDVELPEVVSLVNSGSFGYHMELEGLKDSITEHLNERYCPHKLVCIGNLPDYVSSEIFTTIDFRYDTQAADYSVLDKWEVPNVRCLKISGESSKLKHFELTSLLGSLEITLLSCCHFPDFTSFKLRKLTLNFANSSDMNNISFPELLQYLQLYNSGELSTISICLPGNLKTLHLRRINITSKLPAGLMELSCDEGFSDLDFTQIISLQGLRITAYRQQQIDENATRFAISVPLSLRTLFLDNVDWQVVNINDLVNLTHLTILQAVESRLELPPNLVYCYLTLALYMDLVLNDKLQTLSVQGKIEHEINIPQSMRYLKLQNYWDAMELPDNLILLQLSGYYYPLRAPKNLQYLSFDWDDLQLNDNLRFLFLRYQKVDFDEFRLDNLEYMWLKDCTYEENPPNFVQVGDEEGKFQREWH